jgi:indole-3-glycerol phosphate synthase
MPDRLSEILDHKRTEIAALDAAALRAAAEASPRPRDFLGAIGPLSPSPLSPETEKGEGDRGKGMDRRIRLIAELKRASPSKGMLAPHLDLFQVADIYMDNGAAAISVLTDEKFFLGKLETLRTLRTSHAARVPLLRKDFILAPAQLYEARANGADAALLIVAALPEDAQLADLHALALALGLTALVEVHTAAELERALRIGGVQLIGINNRDLATFNVSLETTERLRPLIPAGIAVVAESGIFTAADVTRLAAAGVDAVLVGEALVTAPDIAAKVRELSGVVAKELHHEGHEGKTTKG